MRERERLILTKSLYLISYSDDTILTNSFSLLSYSGDATYSDELPSPITQRKAG